MYRYLDDSRTTALPARRIWAVVLIAALALFLLPATAHGTSSPSVSNVSPSSGPVTGGTTVTLTGIGFTGTLSVTFGSTPAAFTPFSDNVMFAVSPAHSAGPVDIIVTTLLGPSSATITDRFTFGSVPVILGVSPASGPISGGTAVTITGSGFTGTYAVTFGGVSAASVFVVTDSQLLVVSPPHSAGVVDVMVFTTGGSSTATLADRFSYGGGVIVTGLSPSSGSSSGGTLVTVTGFGFTNAVAVTFAGSAGTFPTVYSDSQLTVISPAHAAGAVEVVVYTGSASSALGGSNIFTYTASPVVLGASPSSGPTSGGTSVTITGTGFTGASGVTFGGVAGTGLSVQSDSQLRVTTPAHAAGSVNIVVSVAGISSPTSSAAVFVYTAVPATDPPARFAGSVLINGAVPPAGTTIAARIDANSCGSTTVFLSSGSARYVLDVPAADAAHPGCGSDGIAVTFLVNGVATPQVGTWRNYQLNLIDLALGAAPTSPPATPTTPPSAPNTGGGLAPTPDSIPGWAGVVTLGAAAILAGTTLAARSRR